MPVTRRWYRLPAASIVDRPRETGTAMAKILLVEDEELENERLAALLRSFGHDVTIMSPERLASDAMLGLSAAPRYDVIITDADAWKSSRDALTHAMRGIFPDAKI